MKKYFGKLLIILPFLFIGFVMNGQPVDDPGLSKTEKKQERAQKKLEQDIKKEKYKAAKEKAKEYAKKANSQDEGQQSPKLIPPVSAEKGNSPKGMVTQPAIKPAVVKSPQKKTKAEKKNAVPPVLNTVNTKKNPVAVAPAKTKKGNDKTVSAFQPPADDQRYRKRGTNCNFTYNVADPMTGQIKRALESRYFFGFTDKELVKFMKGEDYLSCSGFLSDVTGVKTLNLTFTIDSPYARDEYGSIQAGTQMIIRLINGETVTLLSEKYDSGSVSQRTGKTTYKTLFIISAKDEKLLLKNEVDMVRMVWGAGYEDYEVYELDFIIDQLECLNAN